MSDTKNSVALLPVSKIISRTISGRAGGEGGPGTHRLPQRQESKRRSYAQNYNEFDDFNN
jgi:hypothetical protein